LDLLPNLFRTEFSKITSVLCKSFGLAHIETAEDIASETFLAAMETWPYNGIPSNPTAWLYTVARNKARNFIAHSEVFRTKVAQELRREGVLQPEPNIDLSEVNIQDSQLQMLFAVCHPSIPPESQIGLALRILCGFGIDEIAKAFLTNKETINKRLLRAKDKLKSENVELRFPGKPELHTRLDNVLTTLYLLFSEGYYSESNDEVLREDLCWEAMRLTHLLLLDKDMQQPKTYALLSLMCFHSSRFKARKDQSGGIIIYDDQDEALWDKELVARGAEFLHKGSTGTELTTYHIEANIAYWHTIRNNEEKWANILQLYNKLLILQYSPVAALNRTYAIFKVKGAQAAIAEAEKLKLVDNPFYFSLLGELYQGINVDEARRNFEKAMELAGTVADKRIIESKLNALKPALS
jgi:RNA polymerase sigma factor (sigma-70 family)